MSSQTAFSGMLRDVVELNSILLRPEPLDTEIERRCKQAWERTPCPECGETSASPGTTVSVSGATTAAISSRTPATRPSKTALSPDEIVLVFVLHVDTLLSIHQIAQLFDPVYNIIHTTLREGEGAFERGGSGDRGRSRWEGPSGDTLRIIGASRGALRVIRAKRGAQPEELKPALDEVEILSEKLDEVWHDRWRGDAPFAYENK